MKASRWLTLVSPVVLLVLWELAVRFGLLNPLFFPTPTRVLVTTWELLLNGELLTDLAISSGRVAAGFLLGAIPAVLLGLLIGINQTARLLLQPIAVALYPVPKIALLPLVLVVMGLGEEGKIVTIAISVFFLMILEVAASVQQIDPRHFEVARSFGAQQRDVFRTVALPASIPGIMGSIKIGIGFALTLIVGIEFIGANEGLGWMIWRAYELFAIDRMLAGLITIAFAGWLITVVLDEIERWLLPWQATSRHKQEHNPMVERAKVWWRSSRPWSYTAAIIPVALGSVIALSHGFFDMWLFVLTMVGSVLIQAGTNFTNDYYDYVKGADRQGSYSLGGGIVRGDITPRQALTAGLLCFGIGSAIGLYLVSVAGPVILWIGIISVLIGFFYTAGPLALAYVGLGEIAVFIFMGPVIVMGSYYVQAQQLTLPVVLASLPVGFLVAAILHANNLRDIDDDVQTGKRTLATILGRDGANIEFYVLIGGTYLSLVTVVLLGIAPWQTLIAAITIPTAIGLIRMVATQREPGALHPLIRDTAKLHAQFGVLMIIGWAVAVFL